MNNFYDNPDFFDSIEPSKKEFLVEIIEGSKGIKDKSMLLKFFQNIQKEAKEKKITFTADEMSFIIGTIKKNANEKELNIINKFVP